MKSIAIALIPLLLAACIGPMRQTPAPLPGNLPRLAGMATLACGFEKTVDSGGKQAKAAWTLWRQPNRVETRDDMSQQGEIWQKDKSGQIFYTRVFFPERVALEYMPGDLAAKGVETRWEQVEAGLLDPRQLGTKLLLQGQRNDAGVKVEHYSGTLDGVATEVDWLPSLGLPARIAKTFPDRVVTIAMRDCGGLAQTSARPISSQELDAYRRIDFSDLGDMESDPSVQRIIELTDGHHHHH